MFCNGTDHAVMFARMDASYAGPVRGYFQKVPVAFF